MKDFDFALTWDKNPCFFTDTLISSCKEKGLSFLWIKEDNVKDVTKDLERNDLKIKVLLDTEATYDIYGHPYSRVCYAVKDSGGTVINDPDRTRMYVDKTVAHYELLDAGINVPYTVIIRSWEALSFKLTPQEKEKLEPPFIIKPGCGWGHRGVVYDASGRVREIAKARDFDPDDSFLLQRKVYPLQLGDRRAWFRVFHVFNRIIPCWWDDKTSDYRQVTSDEFKKFKLAPLVKIVTKIANITKMSWFSSEMAVEKHNGKEDIVVIDYVNDQCDMEAKTESKDGVPDNIVKFTAYSIIHAAYRIKMKRKVLPRKKYTVLLKQKGSWRTRGLGYAPDLLTQNPKDK